MPRDPNNNPSERLGRLLAEMEELAAYAAELEARLAAVLPAEAFAQLAPRPRLLEMEKERLRRQLTLGRTAATRDYMRRQRLGPSEAPGLGHAQLSRLEDLLSQGEREAPPKGD